MNLLNKPTEAAVPQIPSEPNAIEDALMNSRSIEGQLHREQMLKGKNVVIVTCGFESAKKVIYTRAKELGVNVYLLEDPKNDLAAELESEGTLKEWIKVDMKMRESIIDECVQAITEAFPGSSPDGIVTFWDDAVGLAARIANRFEVKANPVEAVDACHDKYLSRCVLAEAGIPTPKFFRIQNREELKIAAHKMNYPAILKPVIGAASIGIEFVSSAEEAIDAYDRGVQIVSKCFNDGELMDLCFDEETHQGSTFILEEYIDGEEVDVDIVLEDGLVRYVKINSDWAEDGNETRRFIEHGVSFPAGCSGTEIGEAFVSASVKCCLGLGITHGVVHVEMKYSSKYGTTLVELNPRMGGGPLYHFHKQAFDVDLVTEQLLLSCGLPSNPPCPEEPNLRCSCVFFFSENSGICSHDLQNSDHTKELLSRKYVKAVTYYVKKGDTITGKRDTGKYPTTMGRMDLMVKRNELSHEEFYKYCKAVQTEVYRDIRI